MKKKLFILLAVLAMLLMMVPTAFAEEIVAEGTHGENITWTLTTDGTLFISGNGPIADAVVENDDFSISTHYPWNPYESQITKLVVESGITGIPERAFPLDYLKEVTLPEGLEYIYERAFSATAIEEITIPNTVTHLGWLVFSGCKQLETVNIPDTLTSLGNSAFSGCSKLENIHIPSGISEIKDGTFSNCTALKNIIIPANITLIEEYAFQGCCSLESLTIPSHVTTIGDRAFQDCSNLKELIIENGVESIGSMAFAMCSSLESISIPASVSQMDESAFSDCSGLKEIIVDPDNSTMRFESGVLLSYDRTELFALAPCYAEDYYIPAETGEGIEDIILYHYRPMTQGIYVDENNAFYSSDENGILYNKDQTKLYYCPRSFQGSYTVPDTVTKIYDYAFEGCTQLDAITLTSSNGINIGLSALEGCTGLTTVSIPSGSWLSTGAFQNCTNLETVFFNGVVDFMADCFYGCSNLEYVVFDESLENINSSWRYTFGHCPKLKTLIIPNAVRIGHLAFANSSLENIYFIGIAPTIDSWAFGREKNGNDSRITVNVYYPANDESWNDIISAEYEGFVTWIPYDPETDYPCYHMNTELNNATTATCTTPGYTGDTVCTDCGEILESGTEIPKLPHKEVTDKAVAATCTAPGKTEGKHCSVCKAVLVKQETVAATGHTFGQWTQVTAPTQNSEGLEQRQCACGETEQRSIAKLPAEPAPSEPVPSEPAPSEPVPSEPVPSEPVPSEPTPSEPAPSEPKPTHSFTDVVAGSFYEEAVLWAVENEVTTGRTETTFAPGDPCKRSEVVTFLHRAKGKPAPGSVQSEFTDVQIGKFYTDAVAWAVENEITNGMGDGTFGVSRECTRGQVVTFLWRTAGCPEPTTTEHPFTDLDPYAFYYDAVLWAVENGITSGMSDTTFAPGSTCTRAQIVTFLYRFAG